MISQTSEYALRAIVCLANSQGGAMTALEIARLGKVPAGYMAKVLMMLSRAGVLNSRRGLRGGFTLAHPASEMTVLSVINAVDPMRRIHTCPLGLEAHADQLCPLHRRLDSVASLVEASYGSVSIMELLEGPESDRPMCLTRPEGSPEGRMVS